MCKSYIDQFSITQQQLNSLQLSKALIWFADYDKKENKTYLTIDDSQIDLSHCFQYINSKQDGIDKETKLYYTFVNNEIVSLMFCRKDTYNENGVYILHFEVSLKYIHKGFGKQSLLLLEQKLQREHKNAITLYPKCESLIPFYEKCGFTFEDNRGSRRF